MWRKLMERWRHFADVIDGMDDPEGAYLSSLEKRVQRLESDVDALKKDRVHNPAVAGQK